MAQPLLSEDEFHLLSDAQARKRTRGDGVWIIRDRSLTDRHRLDDVTLENIQFEDCDFIGHLMFDVNMKNVTFNGCGFRGSRWEGGLWDDLTFRECASKGKEVSMLAGGGAGRSVFERCVFWGDEPPSAFYEDAMRLYGEISAPGKGVFLNCEFQRMGVRCGAEAEFQDCKFNSVTIDPLFSDGAVDRLAVEKCNGKLTLDIGNRTIRAMTIRDSIFEIVDLGLLQGDTVSLDNVKGAFSLVRTRLRRFAAKGCVFTQPARADEENDHWGLVADLAEIDEVTLSDCRFEGRYAKLAMPGEAAPLDPQGRPVPRFDAERDPIPYCTTIGSLALHRTPIKQANFSYARIKHLLVAGGGLVDSNLAHTAIEKLSLQDVTLAGVIDFTGAKVRELVASNVIREPKLKLIKEKSEISL